MIGISTRRELIRRGLRAGAVGSAAAAADFALQAGDAAGEVLTDAQLLVPLIGTELLVAFGYERVLAAHVLTPRGDRLAQRVLGQEREHAGALTAELRRLGGTPPVPITSVAVADRVLAARQIPESLASLHSSHDAIILLARFEWLLEGAYITAIKGLQAPRLLRLSGQILACEGQHGTMLSELLHPGDVIKAVPSPNVLGTG